MVFSTPLFLFLFLPLVLAAYFGLPRGWRNGVLLCASLFFYAWGEAFLVLVMLASILANYSFGRWLERIRAGDAPENGARRAVAAAVVFNLGLLVAFKYANWLWDNLTLALGACGVEVGEIEKIHLPIGISFFTFQAMSYVVDVYRRQAPVQHNPIDFALYIALFPQLIAGPIVRYKDIALQIVHRTVSRPDFAEGVRRFVIGLGKKVLIANVVAVRVDQIYAMEASELTLSVAWLGAVCFSVQVYFDFSGYSDMAIGLGRMFGFKLRENFNFPYISRSVTEFWSRWHISLSTWFRDYLYIPMGGSRKGRARTYFNLVLVFFLCGLWHGAAWSFVVWGLYHGVFLVVERALGGGATRRLPGVLKVLYTHFILMVSWAFFCTKDIPAGLEYLRTMFGLGAVTLPEQPLGLYLQPDVAVAIVAGVIGSVPWWPAVLAWRKSLDEGGRRRGLCAGFDVVEALLLLAVFCVTAMSLSADTYNPFIYFRF